LRRECSPRYQWAGTDVQRLAQPGIWEATMKRLVLVGALAGAVGLSPAFAHAAPLQAEKPARAAGAPTKQNDGHTTPKQQPDTAPALTAPSGEAALGTVHLAKSVKADGKELPAGTYVVRLTSQAPAQEAKGQTPGLERWVEFVQRGQVKGRELASIVPQSEIAQVEKDTPPGPNSSKVETLKGGDYVRLWIRRGGIHYLVHFPTA
jgi:hypothetical protein